MQLPGVVKRQNLLLTRSIMATPNFNFLAEYAKSSRSSCKNCGNTIDKGELRLAEMVQVCSFSRKIRAVRDDMSLSFPL